MYRIIFAGIVGSSILLFGALVHSALDSTGPPPRLLLGYCFLPGQAAAEWPAEEACRFEGPMVGTTPLNEALSVRISLDSTLAFPASGCSVRWYLHEGWILKDDPSKRSGELEVQRITPENPWRTVLRVVPLRKGTSSPLTVDLNDSIGTCSRLDPVQMSHPVSGPDVSVS